MAAPLLGQEPPAAAPKGMVWIAGGEAVLGSQAGDRDAPLQAGDVISLGTGESAPLLAARLITATAAEAPSHRPSAIAWPCRKSS